MIIVDRDPTFVTGLFDAAGIDTIRIGVDWTPFGLACHHLARSHSYVSLSPVRFMRRELERTYLVIIDRIEERHPFFYPDDPKG